MKIMAMMGCLLKKRGVKSRDNSDLAFERMKELRKILIKKTHDQLELNFSLWTLQEIQNLTIKNWCISVSLVTVGKYMIKFGFTPQKPIKRAYEQDLNDVEKWLEKNYPKIVKRSIKEKAEIHWLDETRLSSQSNYIRSYSPKGKTPILRMKAKHKYNIINI